MATSRRQRKIEALKVSRAYKDAREAKLTQLAIETPDCAYEECTDCCWLERVRPAHPRFPSLVRHSSCPECDGRIVVGVLENGVVK